jgi:hypothetical protein
MLTDREVNCHRQGEARADIRETGIEVVIRHGFRDLFGTFRMQIDRALETRLDHLWAKKRPGQTGGFFHAFLSAR